MNEILEKIDKEITKYELDDRVVGIAFRNGMKRVKEIIQSSQTDVADTNVGKIEHDGCNVCKYKSLEETEYPCRECKRAFIDKWKAISDETVEGE